MQTEIVFLVVLNKGKFAFALDYVVCTIFSHANHPRVMHTVASTIRDGKGNTHSTYTRHTYL